MPQHRFASIHVVGTNGKSSVTRMIAALLEAHGIRAGACVSPHPLRWSERVLIEGEEIGAAEFAAAVERTAQAADDRQPQLGGGGGGDSVRGRHRGGLRRLRRRPGRGRRGRGRAGGEARRDQHDPLAGHRADLDRARPHRVAGRDRAGDRRREAGGAARPHDPGAGHGSAPRSRPWPSERRRSGARGSIVAPEDPGEGIELRAAGPLSAPQLRPRLLPRPRHSSASSTRVAVAAVAAGLAVPGRLERIAEDPPTCSTPPTTPTAPRRLPRRCRRSPPAARSLPASPILAEKDAGGDRRPGPGHHPPRLHRATHSLPTGRNVPYNGRFGPSAAFRRMGDWRGCWGGRAGGRGERGFCGRRAGARDFAQGGLCCWSPARTTCWHRHGWRLALCEDWGDGGEDQSAGSELLSMMALVAAVVAAVILVFFGLGYLFGRLFLWNAHLTLTTPGGVSRLRGFAARRRSRLPAPSPAGPSHGTSDLRHQQQRPQFGRQPLRPDARRGLAGADRLHVPRRPAAHLRSLPGRLRDDRLLHPLLGTAVYAIVRPPEFLEDAHERELEIRAAELRVRQLNELSCPNCAFPIEKSLPALSPVPVPAQEPLPSCSKPVDPRWALCPYCEKALQGASARSAEKAANHPVRSDARLAKVDAKRRQARGAPASTERSQPAGPQKRRGARRNGASRAERGAGGDQETQIDRPKQTKRSPSRESDADPRQA